MHFLKPPAFESMCMDTSLDEDGSSVAPHQGYSWDLYNLLGRIENSLPLRTPAAQSELRAAFTQAADFILANTDGPHNDFGHIVTQLFAIAEKQPSLRQLALATVNKFPPAFDMTDGRINDRFAMIDNFKKYLLACEINPPEARLEAVAGLRRIAVYGGTGFGERALEALQRTLSSELPGKVRQALDEAIGAVEATQIASITQGAQRLSLVRQPT